MIQTEIHELEQRLKQAHARRDNLAKEPSAQAECGQTMLNACNARPSLMERVQTQLGQAQRDAHRAVRLSELHSLLNDHPEFGRMLDLMEEVR